MMGLRTALDTRDSEVLLQAERPGSACCRKAGGFGVPGMQIWEMVKVCHTSGSSSSGTQSCYNQGEQN